MQFHLHDVVDTSHCVDMTKKRRTGHDRQECEEEENDQNPTFMMLVVRHILLT